MLPYDDCSQYLQDGIAAQKQDIDHKLQHKRHSVPTSLRQSRRSAAAAAAGTHRRGPVDPGAPSERFNKKSRLHMQSLTQLQVGSPIGVI